MANKRSAHRGKRLDISISDADFDNTWEAIETWDKAGLARSTMICRAIIAKHREEDLQEELRKGYPEELVTEIDLLRFANKLPVSWSLLPKFSFVPIPRVKKPEARDGWLWKHTEALMKQGYSEQKIRETIADLAEKDNLECPTDSRIEEMIKGEQEILKIRTKTAQA